jgi:hypothetical protein
MNIQAVDQLEVESASPEIPCQIEKPERLGPEIVGGKIVDPGIDEDQGGRRVFGGHHGFHSAQSIERRAKSKELGA